MSELEGEIEIYSNLPPVPQEDLVQIPHELDEPMGENLGEDIRRAAALHANSKVSKSSENEHIYLGEEHGVHKARDTRFRDSAKKGFLTAYVRTREVASDHKVVTTITVSTVAIGAVLAGVHALKHRRD